MEGASGKDKLHFTQIKFEVRLIVQEKYTIRSEK